MLDRSLYHPLVVWPPGLYWRPPGMTAQQLANFFQWLALQDADSPVIQSLALRLRGRTPRESLMNLWRAFPVVYVPDGINDTAQTPIYTWLRGRGDCEDWALFLVALLLALNIGARIGIMNNHAAVFVPLLDRPDRVDALGQTILGPWDVSPKWQTRQYAGRGWLPLEATAPMGRRGEPGDYLELIDGGIQNASLRIAA